MDFLDFATWHGVVACFAADPDNSCVVASAALDATAFVVIGNL